MAVLAVASIVALLACSVRPHVSTNYLVGQAGYPQTVTWYNLWSPQGVGNNIPVFLPRPGVPQPGGKKKKYGYSAENGPDTWALDYPDCAGSKQSPVNLETLSLYRVRTQIPLQWRNYWLPPLNTTLENDGLTVKMTGSWDPRLTPSIAGGPLNADYVFAQLHFHWGAANNEGSEHTVNNYSYPLELHAVHYKREYGSLSNAVKKDDGLAVVATLFQLSPVSNPLMNGLIFYFNAITGAQLKVAVPPVPLNMLVGTFSANYVMYSGSLTTPPCSEVVTWLIGARPSTISPSQLGVFRRLTSTAGDVSRNFRPVQPINRRTVYYV